MIKHYRFGIARVLVNSINGEIRYFMKDIDEEKTYEVFLYQDPTFNNAIFPQVYDNDSYSKITLSLNFSTKCNLNCKYCFLDHKEGETLYSLEKIKEEIENFVKRNIKKKKIFVDLSGSGEPLINLVEVIAIAKWCKKLERKYKVNVIMQFVTNGTLLDEKTVKLLQDNAVLFGVSLDGTKENHDKNRVFSDGRPSYDLIEKNMKAIEEKQFLGSAMVIDGSFNTNLLNCYLNMSKLSTTTSIKFKRSDHIDEYKDKADYIIGEYFNLMLYLIQRIIENDYQLLFSILRGDDTFGTMLSRVIIDNKVFARCDGGVGRISLGKNYKIYPCAPSIVNSSFEGEEGINYFKSIAKIDYCNDCECKFYCGGECPLVKEKLKSNDIYLCKIKKKLFEYSLYFKAYLLKYKKEALNTISSFIYNKEAN